MDLPDDTREEGALYPSQASRAGRHVTGSDQGFGEIPGRAAQAIVRAPQVAWRPTRVRLGGRGGQAAEDRATLSRSPVLGFIPEAHQGQVHLRAWRAAMRRKAGRPDAKPNCHRVGTQWTLGKMGRGADQ